MWCRHLCNCVIVARCRPCRPFRIERKKRIHVDEASFWQIPRFRFDSFRGFFSTVSEVSFRQSRLATKPFRELKRFERKSHTGSIDCSYHHGSIAVPERVCSMQCAAIVATITFSPTTAIYMTAISTRGNCGALRTTLSATDKF